MLVQRLLLQLTSRELFAYPIERGFDILLFIKGHEWVKLKLSKSLAGKKKRKY